MYGTVRQRKKEGRKIATSAHARAGQLLAALLEQQMREGSLHCASKSRSTGEKFETSGKGVECGANAVRANSDPKRVQKAKTSERRKTSRQENMCERKCRGQRAMQRKERREKYRNGKRADAEMSHREG